MILTTSKENLLFFLLNVADGDPEPNIFQTLISSQA